jgi:cysteine desulfurase
MKPIYLDYNATTPILPRVFEAIKPYLTEHFGNPSSGHAWGLAAARAVDNSHDQVAALLNCGPGEVVFTSCATESNTMVMRGLCEHRRSAHLIISAIEHPATMACADFLESVGVRVSRVPVNAEGLVSPDDVAAACKPDTALISIMLANNETGAIQPVAEIAAMAKKRGIPLHTDAAQAVGKIQVDLAALGVDFLTVAGHKLFAPKGVGALYVRQGSDLPPMLRGGGQEGGYRAGTENVPYMVALGQACVLASEDLEHEIARQEELGRVFLAGIEQLGVPYVLHSANAPRLPNTMAIGFKGFRAADLLSGLVGMDVAVSAGAACHGDTTTVSHVLEAMAVPDDYAHGTLRFSWGRPTTREEMEQVLDRLGQVLSSITA